MAGLVEKTYGDALFELILEESPAKLTEAKAELDRRSAAGIIPREPRKGFYRLYTQQARSAMQGGGLE